MFVYVACMCELGWQDDLYHICITPLRTHQISTKMKPAHFQRHNMAVRRQKTDGEE